MTLENLSADEVTLVPRADRAAPVLLPVPFHERYRDAAGYDPDPDLTAAVNVALLLGQPLLLTGEPGCGKTSLAFWLARELGLDEPLLQPVKSTTTGRDLLYGFDDLARFRDSQTGTRRPAVSYLGLNALGQAILVSAGPERALKRLDAGPAADGIARHGDLHPVGYPERRRRVVLIDELDKAPRDTPNDLLLEIEAMRFDIPELRVTVEGDPANRPIVVITSNSEKSLPEPFLRRCVYHHIPAPDAKRRREIVERRRAPFAQRGGLFDEAMTLFGRVHGSLGRAPGTAELLAWLDVLETLVRRAEAAGGAVAALETEPAILRASLRALAKTQEDLESAEVELGIAGRV